MPFGECMKSKVNGFNYKKLYNWSFALTDHHDGVAGVAAPEVEQMDHFADAQRRMPRKDDARLTALPGEWAREGVEHADPAGADQL